MANGQFIYRVTLETGQAAQAARQLQAIMREVNRSAASDPQARAAAASQLEQQRRITTDARAQSQIRVAAVRAEMQQRTAAQQVQAARSIKQERRLTAAFKSELSPRTAAQRQAASQSQQQSGLASVRGAIGGAVAGYLSIQGGRQLLQEAAELDQLRGRAIATNQALTLLAGGSGQASAAIAEIQRVAPGATSSLAAAEAAVTILSQKLPSAAVGIKQISEFAAIVPKISPSISDSADALSQLTLFANSNAWARADQLGAVSADVQARMKELAETYPQLSDSQLKAAATVLSVTERYAPLIDKLDETVTGTQKLATAWSEMRVELAKGPVGQAADQGFSNVAGFLNRFNATFVSNDLGLQSNVLQDMIAGQEAAIRAAVQGREKPNFITQLFGGPASDEALSGARQRLADLEKAAAIVDRIQQMQGAGLQIGPGLRQEIDEVISSITNWGEATDDQIERLKQLEAASRNAALVAEDFSGGGGPVEFTPRQQALIDERAYNEALNRVSELQQRLGEIDGLPGADQIASQVSSLALELVYSTGVTDEQSSALNELEKVIDGAANAAGYFTGATGGATGATANFGIQINGLIGPMTAAEAGLYAMGDAADDAWGRVVRALGAAGATDQFNALQGQYQGALLGAARSIVPLVGSGGASDFYNQRENLATEFIQGLQADKDLSDAERQLKLLEFTDQQTAAAEQMVENAREAERLQKRAASEAERAYKEAARETEKAFKDAASDFIAGLESTPGLFGTSDVTQQQLDLAKAGVPQNFADNYLRRLRDEVENKKDYEGVSIEGAREALARVGIIAADNAKAVVEQLAQAWEDSSLFASKENLALIDQSAVQENLNLQDKIKEGRRNILEYFSETVDDALKPYILGEDVEVTQGAGGGFVVTPKPKVDLSGIALGTGGTATGGIAGIDPTAIQAQLSALTTPPITVSAISVDPAALASLWSGLTPPAITITEVSVGPNAHTSFAENLKTQFTGASATEGYRAIGSTVGYYIESGVTGRTEHLNMAGSLRPTFDDQLDGLKEQFVALGNKPALWVEQGLKDYVHGDMAQDLASDIADQMAKQIDTFKSQGGTVASIVEAGFTGYKHGDMALSFFNKLAGQFGGPGAHGEASNLDKFSSMGMTLASVVERGFADPERKSTGLASPLIIAIQTDFAQQEHIDSLRTVGETAGYWVESGLVNYPWAGVASSLINEIQTGLATEENIELLVAAGKNTLGEALARGVEEAFADRDWTELADSIVTGVLESLADTETT